MKVVEEVKTALSVAFVVMLDNEKLGTFSSCDGLGCEVVLETREEGGNNGFVWQIPTRLRYPNIKLTRPLSPETSTIAKWFAGMANGYKRGITGTIQAMTADGKVIASWSFIDVVPVRWTGPTFSADSPQVLTESIEIAHHGFIDPGKG